MGEWASYGLSDFLMFSPQTYWRLVERYNAALWPAQVVALLSALPAFLLARSRPWVGAAVLAAAWAWVGWAFHWQRYAEIFVAGPALAVACAVQALLLAGAAALRTAPERGHRAATAAGIAMVLLYPLLALLEGRPLRQAEIFGLMPDPTALATLAWLAACSLPRWSRWLLAPVPALSLALGLATRSQFAQ